MNKNAFLRPLTLGLILAVLAGSAISAFSFQTGKAGSPITVNSTTDSLSNDGSCTLREAIIAANKDQPSGSKPNECPAGSGVDTIILPAGTYILTRTDSGKEDSASTGDLDIKADLTIQGAGAGVTIIDTKNFKDRVFQNFKSKVSITGVTIRGGNVSGDGGGISNTGTLTITDSIVTGNTASEEGAGIFNDDPGKVTVVRSTISNNSAGTDGGGLDNDDGSVTITNSTISGNSAKNSGGGIYNEDGLSLNNVTIAQNTADSNGDGKGDGGGIFQEKGTLNFKNTIIAGNKDNSKSSKQPDCSGTLTSQGYNLVQSIQGGCKISGVSTGNLTGVDPKLGPLANNGGPTQTQALLANSPAINAGNPAQPGSGGNACELTDQRGRPRPVGTACDIGAYESGQPNTPVVIRVTAGATGATIEGRVTDAVNSTFTLNSYTSPTCTSDGLGTSTFLSSNSVATDSNGNTYFTASTPAIPAGQFVAVTSTDAYGATSAASPCVTVSAGNDSWPNAQQLELSGNPTIASVDQYVDTQGQSRWYKFSVQPNSQLIVTLTNLPANYDLTLYKDITAAYQTLSSTQDLARVGAESAPSAFTPSAFTPSAFTPSAFTAISQDAFSSQAFSPSAFTPSAFTPSAFTPSAFTPSAFTPSAFTPAAISPDALTPSAFTPSAFTPSAFTPSAFTPSAFTPSILDPAAFSSAQTRSLIGVSAFDGTTPEGLLINTWNNTGNFYIRVRGREGAFSLTAPFHLQVEQLPGNCGTIDTTLQPSNTIATTGNYKTVILTDLSRMVGTDAEIDTLWSRLNAFAARPEVAGVIVNLGSYSRLSLPGDNRVMAANAQADAKFDCPFAKNLVAGSIKGIVDSYRALNPLEYVVIVGNDNTIPFFRYPDQSLLGSENNYVPPVKDNTSSQASLRLNYVLSQDAYGSSINLSFLSNVFPIPNLAVGRLVETPSEATNMLNAYMGGNPAGGDVVVTPQSAMVTGYDFLADSASAVSAEFKAGLGSNGSVDDTLIADRSLSPSDPRSWTADQLRQHFLSTRHDITFLAGHFSAVSAEAADYQTYMLTTDLLSSPVDLTNALIFSAGCHSGYNIVNQDGVSGVTFEPDWSQAFARKGATLIAGTGYQYGDTDFIQYSERLYLNFSQQLRTGPGAVSVGKALVAAKQAYLSSTPQLRGIHEKTVLESTLFGLPMLKVNMPGARLDPGNSQSIVSSTTPFQTKPGSTLGMQFADVSVIPSLTQNNVQLANLDGGSPVTAVYFSGTDGVLTNPSEPALPLEVRNASVPSLVLRGIGFRGGIYSDLSNVLPLVGAPTTEIRGVHTPFFTNIFYPVQPWDINYIGALADSINGPTRLVITPAQFRTGDPDSANGIMRTFNKMDFRLFYSSYIQTGSDGSAPALAAAPTIVQVQSAVPDAGTVTFNVNVIGNPAAGIQQVWVTWTDTSNPGGGTWQSLDLSQNGQDSTLWQGALSLNGATAANIRYLVQACNGVGLCTLASNLGAYYIPGVQAAPSQPSSLALDSQPASGSYSSQATFSAVLTSNNTPLADQRVVFTLGAQGRQAVTDSTGRATATFPLLGVAGNYDLSVFFGGSGDFQPSSTGRAFQILKQTTALSLNGPGASVLPGADTQVVATLTDSAGNSLIEKNVCFVIGSFGRCLITDNLGHVFLGITTLPKDVYTVNAYFSGSIPLSGGAITLSDDRYQPSTATGSLKINTPPVAANDAYAAKENVSLAVPAPGVLGNDTDADNDALQAVLVSGPANGAITLNADGSFSYTPNAAFFGSDGFTYYVTDGIDTSPSAQVTINVLFVNQPPSFTVGADQSLNEDAGPQSVAGWATNISPGPANESGQTVAFLVANNNNALFSALPAIDTTGTLSYTPAPNANGSALVTVNLKDSGGTDNGGQDTSPAQTFVINVTPVNDTPSFLKGPDQTVPENSGQQNLTGWATSISPGPADESGQTLTFLVSNDNNSLFSEQPVISPDGTLTYTPAPNAYGSASVTVVLNDSGGTDNGGIDTSATQTFVITVTQVNQPPVAVDDAYSMYKNKVLKVAAPGVLANDSDPNGDQLTVSLVSGPKHGKLTLNPDGSFTYTPNHDFCNTDSFVYRVSDGHGGITTAKVTITVKNN